MAYARYGQSVGISEHLPKADRLPQPPMTIEAVAAWFCGLDDELQADFFVQVARLAEHWPERQRQQWLQVGGHLATCECSTPGAVALIDALHDGLHAR